MPTVVDTVEGPGASRTPSMNKVAGTTPPPSENSADRQVAQRRRQAPARRSGAPNCANAATLPSAMTTKPQRNRRSGATPRWSSRPPDHVADDVDGRRERGQRRVPAARHAGVGIDRRQEADHGHPLRGVDRESQRQRPRTAGTSGVAQADAPALCRAGGRSAAAGPVRRHRQRHPDAAAPAEHADRAHHQPGQPAQAISAGPTSSANATPSGM